VACRARRGSICDLLVCARAFVFRGGTVVFPKCRLMTDIPNPNAPPLPELRVIPRDVHGISRKQMSRSALKVLYHLRESGFNAYLVGGAVRDLLVGRTPKDFDVATDATPEQVKAIFRNCRLIGRRFRLAHVVFGREIIEVATF